MFVRVSFVPLKNIHATMFYTKKNHNFQAVSNHCNAKNTELIGKKGLKADALGTAQK